MSSNESSPRLHGLPQSCMDSFYQQPMQSGSIPFDRFGPYNQNVPSAFPNYPHAAYGTLVPQRQPVSSNTLPSIGNFSDPLSFMPFSSPHVPVHTIDRRESLPEFSALGSCAVDGNSSSRPYVHHPHQDGKQNVNNAESVSNMYMVPHNMIPQRDKSQKTHHQQSPALPPASLPQPNISTSSHLSYIIPQHSQPLHSDHMTRYRPDNFNKAQATIHSQEDSAQSIYSSSNIPTSMKPPTSSTAQHFNSFNHQSTKPHKAKSSPKNENRSGAAHIGQSSKRKIHHSPKVIFNLLGRLEIEPKEPGKVTVNASVQTDLRMLLNTKSGRRKTPVKNTPSQVGKVHNESKVRKEVAAEEDVPESFNVLSAADIDEYQNFETDTKPSLNSSTSPVVKTMQTKNNEANNLRPSNGEFQLPTIKSENNGWDENENTNGQSIMTKNSQPNLNPNLMNLNPILPNLIPNLPKLNSNNMNPNNVQKFDHKFFQSMPMSAFKGKDKDAEMERMEINVKIDDSQYVAVGDGPKRWQCNQCTKSYTTKHNLVTHVLDHNGIKPHLCMICGKYFKQLSHLNTHMLTHDNVKPHICTVCGKGFTQISHLKRHQTVHLESKPHICDICKRGFAYPSELRLHKEKHVPGKNRCTECNEDFGSPKLLKEHQTTHENREDHECPECQRLFRYPSQLKDHLKSHSGYRPYICTECGMDFIKEHHLKAHQFTHTGLRPYECSQCGKAFNQRANMLRHQLIHNSDRAYKCEQCDKTFTQQQTLKAHMVVHAERKPHQCQLCGKEFGRFHNLAAHMHMHSDSKPFLCFCGSSFTLKGNLKRHKKIKHGIVDDSTESMEEEAVTFLSTMSVRATQNTSSPLSVETSQDSQDSNENSHTSEQSQKIQNRKSTPRKIPQPDTEGSEQKNQTDNDGKSSQYFEALQPSDVRGSGKLLAMKRSYDEMNGGDAGNNREGGYKHRKIQNTDILPGENDEDDDDLEEEDDEEEEEDEFEDEVSEEELEDDDWAPDDPSKPRVTKGKKLASVLAEKFSRSKQ